MGIKTNCFQCGIEIEVFPYLYKTMEKHFCGSTCYGFWQRGKKLSPERIRVLVGSHRLGPLNVSCKLCGKNFHRPPSEIRDQNFCSNEHRRQFQANRKKEPLYFRCIFCGQEFKTKSRRKYCSWTCVSLADRKAYIIKKGYKKILQPNHPRADSKGYVFEHILVLERKLERAFRKNEVSHHLDGNKLNNSPDNLVTFPNHSIHIKNGHSSK